MRPTDKYLSLIPAQHRKAVGFMTWIDTLLSLSDPVYKVGVFLDAFFDIDNAIGGQLDILGTILGVSRVLNYEPPQGLSPVLTDELYRLILKCKIVKNHWDGKEETLYRLWATIFDTPIIIQDNQDMSFDAVIVSPVTSMIRVRELAEHGYIVPKPEGVRIKFAYLEKGPIFAYDSDTSMLKGYNLEAQWVETQRMVAFGYNVDTASITGYDKSKWT